MTDTFYEATIYSKPRVKRAHAKCSGHAQNKWSKYCATRSDMVWWPQYCGVGSLSEVGLRIFINLVHLVTCTPEGALAYTADFGPHRWEEIRGRVRTLRCPEMVNLNSFIRHYKNDILYDILCRLTRHHCTYFRPPRGRGCEVCYGCMHDFPTWSITHPATSFVSVTSPTPALRGSLLFAIVDRRTSRL